MKRLADCHGSVDIYFSDAFKVRPSVIDRYGAFDVSLVADLPLFIDPFLLFCSKKKKYRDLHDDIIRYLVFLRDMSCSPTSSTLDPEWYTFREVKQNWLGFSLTGNRGRGLGKRFASALNRNLASVFANFGSESITKSSHLEKLALVDSGVGRDMISDFTTNLIKSFLLQYTAEFAARHIDRRLLRFQGVSRARFDYDRQCWLPERFLLPWYEPENDYVILTPKDMLTRDDTWISRSDLHRRVLELPEAVSNTALRSKVNSYFRRQLAGRRRVSREEKERAIAATLREFPELIDIYIRLREDQPDEATSSSRRKVSNSHGLYVVQFRRLSKLLQATTAFYELRGGTETETRQRIEFLRDVIESKGGYKILYKDGRPICKETDLHILYRLTWFGTLSDVSREVDDGRGPADFKISRGAWDKTIVEFKLASNTNLKRNLERQAEAYKKASDARTAYKVVFYFSEEEKRRVDAVLRELGFLDHPNVFLIDARSDNKPSGSKA